jgi:2-dehydro-3-deoxygluconokinase
MHVRVLIGLLLAISIPARAEFMTGVQLKQYLDEARTNSSFKGLTVGMGYVTGVYDMVDRSQVCITKELSAREAMQIAKRNGVIVSYDLNYRDSLWKGIGGPARAREVNRELAPLIDVMLGNEEDFTAALGFEVEGLDEQHSKLEVGNFQKMIGRAVQEFPNFKVVATTLRNAKTATINDWGAVCFCDGQLYQAPTRENLEIFDRVGGGDSFASGLIYGFLTNKGPQWAVECGAAHGALAMTTPGDTTMATLAEVEKVMKGGTARVER